MARPANSFVWYQLLTTDPAAATGFYGDVVGWTAQGLQGPARNYTVLLAAGAGVGGLMALTPDLAERGVPPHWTGYVGVDDVDATAARIAELGGALHHPPEDIEGIGRFAVAADPQGAVFIIFKPNSIWQRPAPAPGAQGQIGWHELHAADWPAAFEFYANLFAWTKTEAHDMGPAGAYQLFATGNVSTSGESAGGMLNRMNPAMPPHWLYYFNVTDINDAMRRVHTAGGQVLNGPHQVPGGSWIVHCKDPQDAVFALVAPPA
jgi:predicted enzyme related to lactoylglutathione lyase